MRGSPLTSPSLQFPLILNQAGDLTNCSIPNSQFSSEGAVGLGTIRFFRMRIENWELVRFSRSCIRPSYFCASPKSCGWLEGRLAVRVSRREDECTVHG